MSAETQAASWLIVACILTASYYFYSNHRFLTYVHTADTFEPFLLNIPPKALTSIMENTCSWPVLPVVNISVAKSFRNHLRNIRCDPVIDPFAFLDDFGFLEISKPVIGGDLFVDTDISCYYQPLLDNKVGDVILGKAEKVEFNVPVAVKHKQIVVKCQRESSPKELIYNKAFVNVPVAMGPATEPKFVKSDPERPSLAMLVFDSVSLNHFKRNMPNTAKFLVENDFFTFNMFNEMSDDSATNLFDVFSGGAGRAGDTFIWDVMKDRQCLTYLSEEVGDFPSFLGNMTLDVEYDLRPYYAYSKQTTRGYCTLDGRVISNEYLENWRSALLHSRERCHFSMHYMRAFTYGSAESLSILDLSMRRSLEILKANGLFENTAIVLLSGRGNSPKLGDELFTARVEERSPLLSIKLPEKFLKKHFMPKLFMEKNVNRLTSTKDLAFTLMDLANMTFTEAPEFQDYDEYIGGASFLRVSQQEFRSCDDANIPPHLCLCMDEKTIESEEYKNDTREFQQLFDHVRTEILQNDCVDEVLEAQDNHELKVLSLNAMVQQGVKGEKGWSEVRKSHYDLGMKYVDITVSVKAIQRSTDSKKPEFWARMRFRKTEKDSFEPIGSAVVLYSYQKCFARRVDQYCEMCYYNRLITKK